MQRETASIERLTEIAAILSAEFNVEPPRIELRHKRGASYQPFFRVILFPVRGSWRGVEITMLHEFAHHLHQMTVPWEQRKHHRHHGPVFRDLLHKVAASWYGDAGRYEWGTEYKSIQEWYRKRIRKRG